VGDTTRYDTTRFYSTACHVAHSRTVDPKSVATTDKHNEMLLLLLPLLPLLLLLLLLLPLPLLLPLLPLLPLVLVLVLVVSQSAGFSSRRLPRMCSRGLCAGAM
jgi:hypothetical protein